MVKFSTRMKKFRKGGGFQLIAIALLAIFVVGILYAVFTGKIGGLTTTTIITNTETVNLLETPQKPPSTICTLGLNPTTVFSGDVVTGAIHDGRNAFCEVFGNLDGRGWEKIYEGTTDANGLLSGSDTPDETGLWKIVAACGIGTADQCVTTQQNLRVLPRLTPPPTTAPPSGSEVGDILDGGTSGSGVLDGHGMDWDVSPYALSDEPGPIILGVKIEREWDYVHPENAAMCYQQINFFPTVDWNFFDSGGFRWGASDRDPVAVGVEVCPVSWDKFNPWRFEVVNVKPLPGCEINYDWNIDIYVCDIID